MAFRKSAIANIALILLAAKSVSVFAEAVPEEVAKRAEAIARSMGGTGTVIKQISRAPSAPGLRQATQVIYNDERGALQNLIMLPDGIHFIAGPLGSYDPDDGTISDATGVKRTVAQQVLAPLPEKPSPGPFKLDGVLRPANFSTAGRSLFKDIENAPGNYMKVLAEAKGIKEGTGGQEIYMLVDPACPYCMLKYKELRPLIQASQVTVYWIPVIGPSQPPYNDLLALSDPGATNDERLSRLQRLAAGKAITESVKQPEEAEIMLQRTTALLTVLRSERSVDRSAGTPQMFFTTPDGVIHHQYGYSNDNLKELKTLLKP